MIHSFDLIRSLTAFVAVAILISGLDDLFIDVCYYGFKGRRRFAPTRSPKVTESDLRERPEQAIAVMIPAWHEHAVIGQMLSNTLRTVEYKDYDIFVGTYPNDEATMLAVARIAEEDPRVHRVVCPHNGPTNKADCLNWIIEGIRHYDKVSKKKISIIMLHDSEDLVHPLSFKLMNYFIPRYPMVQLPVIPFETSIMDLTAGTYLDEFAEQHMKDMAVREFLSGMVPSAGVGTGFSRSAIERLALKHNNQIFNVGTFTEDYDLAFRLKAIGEGSTLIQFAVERTKAVRCGWLKKEEKVVRVREVIGTREYFPNRFKDAVRQKSRWTLGIVFHGWQQRGWEGNWALRYMVWRDRKTLLTQSVNMLGYVLLLETLVSAHTQTWHGFSHAAHVPVDGWVWNVILADTGLLLNRCVQRVVCILRVSNAKQAVFALPRIVWGNIINFFAVAKATHLFFRTEFTGKKLVWAKTAHAFPSEAELLNFKRKLGDLLLEKHLVSLAHLTQALKSQKETGRLLGEILVDFNFVTESEVVATLGSQLKIETRRVDARELNPESFELIGEYTAREHLMVLLSAEERPAVIAAADTQDVRMKRWLDANFPGPYRLVLAGRKNIVEAIEQFATSHRYAKPVTVRRANHAAESKTIH